MVTRTGEPVDAMTAAIRRSKPWYLLALLLLTLLTALPPLLLVPPTTKSDETYHWAYATYVAQTGALPPYLSPDDATSRVKRINLRCTTRWPRCSPVALLIRTRSQTGL